MAVPQPSNDPPRRFLYLIRHGQYKSSDQGGVLTTLGRRQARATAKWLTRIPVDAIHSSDLSRAVETAEIIAERLGLDLRRSRALREMMPTAVPGYKVPLSRRRESRENLETIKKRWLQNTRTTRHELIVCHGNLIRALTCQILGARLTAWLTMGTYHCSITKMSVSRDQGIRLLSFNETAHLAPSQVTSM